jgi:hypothetical protein
MKKVLFTKALVAISAVGLFTGCATLSTDEGAAGIAKQIRPEYSKQINQIADLLVGKRVNPVEGFAREERWFYKAEEINPSDLKLEVLYRNNYQINAAYLQPSVGVIKPEGEVSDKELRSEIEAILNAAGVGQ